MAVWPRSLRVRLTLWFLLIFGVIQTALGGAWGLVRYDAAKTRLDRILHARAAETARLIEEADVLWDAEQLDAVAASLERTAPSELCALRLRRGDGQDVGMSRRWAELGLATLPFRSDGGVVLRWITVRVGSREAMEARVMTVPVMGRERPLNLDIVVIPRLMAAILVFVEDFFAIALPMGLVAASIAGWLIAGRVTAPLEEIAEATESLSPTSLEQRIDIDASSVEIDSLQDRLNEALDRLEEGYRGQERFISNVSHELKTPIAALLTQAQVLAESDSLERYEEFRASVEEEMRHLGKLVESFLTLARADRGKSLARNVRVSLNDMALDVIERLSPNASASGVRIVPVLAEPDAAGAAEIEGDPELLQTMLENLVRNAVKFSPSGSTVNVEVILDRSASGWTVRDRGPGIPAEHIDHIFDRYYQAPKVSARERGTGLGLAIARSIARLHGASIRANNCEDGGCRFDVEFPRGPSGAPSR